MSSFITPYTWISASFVDGYEVIAKGQLPSWFANGDAIIRRGTRFFARSLTQTEPRYRQVWRRLRGGVIFPRSRQRNAA